jgi:hypothetical protein
VIYRCERYIEPNKNKPRKILPGLLPASDLGLETALDRIDGTAGATGFARHEEDPVLFREKRVRGLARLACDVLDWNSISSSSTNRRRRKRQTDIASQNVLDLLLRETALDDQARGAVDGASCTHLSKHELDDVLRLPMHTLADVADVREDRLLIAFTGK